MRYYTLDYVANKETGSQFPQIQEMSKGYDYSASNSVHSLKGSRFPEQTPNFNSFLLHSKAKLSDLISEGVTGGGGMVVSEKFKDILDSVNLVSHKYYPIKIIHKGIEHTNYFWLHIISDLTEYVDYTKSKFFIYKNFAFDQGDIQILSKEDLIKKRLDIKKEDSSLTIWSKQITFLPSFDKNLDMFIVSLFDAKTYISDALKNKIEQEKITGIKITVANNIYLE
jgi:hypothetical protein